MCGGLPRQGAQGGTHGGTQGTTCGKRIALPRFECRGRRGAPCDGLLRCQACARTPPKGAKIRLIRINAARRSHGGRAAPREAPPVRRLLCARCARACVAPPPAPASAPAAAAAARARRRGQRYGPHRSGDGARCGCWGVGFGFGFGFGFACCCRWYCAQVLVDRCGSAGPHQPLRRVPCSFAQHGCS